MKKIIIVASALTIMLSSCSVQSNAKFTSVEKVMQLKLNTSLDETIKTLGTSPYNVYSSQMNGYTIYEYKYKLVERFSNQYKINAIGGETEGKEAYNPKEQKLFLFFKGGKLEAFITEEGKKNSPSLVLLNNTVYNFSSKQEKYTLDVSSINTKSKSASALPSLIKKK